MLPNYLEDYFRSRSPTATITKPICLLLQSSSITGAEERCCYYQIHGLIVISLFHALDVVHCNHWAKKNKLERILLAWSMNHPSLLSQANRSSIKALLASMAAPIKVHCVQLGALNSVSRVNVILDSVIFPRLRVLEITQKEGEVLVRVHKCNRICEKQKNSDLWLVDVCGVWACVLTEAVRCNETEGAAEREHDKRRQVTGEQEAGDCSEVTMRTGEL